MIAEYVSIAHPDRMADLLAAKLITYLQTSPDVHAAIEVLCVKKTVIFSGESNAKVSRRLLKKVVKEVMKDCGYERRTNFGKDDFATAKDIKIANLINSQSEDIALSTTDKKDKSGWNDQGIFFASYDETTPTGQNITKFLAQSFGDYLFDYAFKNKDYGTDIKVLMESVDSFIQRVVVAIPTVKTTLVTNQEIKIAYMNWCREVKEKYNITVNPDVSHFEVNTSGKYTKHGMIADTGITGRKIAVNCLDTNYKNGGGSMIKPWHSADLLVPLILRECANIEKKSLMGTTAIGTNFLTVYSDDDEIFDVMTIDLLSEANKYRLFDGKSYYKMVKRNFQ